MRESDTEWHLERFTVLRDVSIVTNVDKNKNKTKTTTTTATTTM